MLFNSGVVEAISSALPLWIAILMLFISYAGSIYIIAPGVLFGYLYGERERTATWLGIIIAAYALFVAIKPLTDITRPAVDPPLSPEMLPVLLVPLYEAGVNLGTGSFPSGHVLATTVFWGLVVLDLKVSTFRRRLLAAVTMISLVAFSRIALTVHYIGDVIGGFLLGLGLLAAAVTIRRRARQPANAVLVLAVPPAVAGIALGRPVDGAILLLAVVAAYAANNRIDPDWRPTFPASR